MLPEFREVYKAVIMKIVLYCHKNRCIDERSRIENPEINPHICNQSVFNRGGKNLQ